MNTSKAVAAGLGGLLGGAGVSGVMLPEGTPWWGYLIATLLPTILAAVTTYAAPKNTN